MGTEVGKSASASAAEEKRDGRGPGKDVAPWTAIRSRRPFLHLYLYLFSLLLPALRHLGLSLEWKKAKEGEARAQAATAKPGKQS